MATYVLVHGSGTGGWIYRPVAKILRAAGHDVYTPTLTGMGERVHLLSEAVDLNLHIQDIVNLLEFEDLRDVILAGHSYTGMVITGVADRALERVGQLVYLDATRPRDGESQADVIPEAMAGGKADSRMIDGLLMAMVPGSLFHENCKETLQKHGHAWMIERLRPLPYHGCYETKLEMRNPDAVLKIPTTSIRCSQVPWEAKQLERMRDSDNFWEIDTGHGLMISEPEKTAQMLLRLA
jgi:pimeloyl-ACP methyl ester carboxylesterase